MTFKFMFVVLVGRIGDVLRFLNVIFANDNELQAISNCTNLPLERDSENSITNQVSGKNSQAVEK